MLLISSGQMAAFRDIARWRSAERIAAALRHGYPDIVFDLDTATLRDAVERNVAEAAKFGIVKELDLLGYVCVILSTGADRTDDSAAGWPRRMLMSKRLSAATKIAWLARAHGVSSLLPY